MARGNGRAFVTGGARKQKSTCNKNPKKKKAQKGNFTGPNLPRGKKAQKITSLKPRLKKGAL